MEDMKLMCGRCYDYVNHLNTPKCEEKPELRGNLGMYHCPECGAMLIGGIKHMLVCDLCLINQHPRFDRGID
jgi:hypothetical protein